MHRKQYRKQSVAMRRLEVLCQPCVMRPRHTSRLRYVRLTTALAVIHDEVSQAIEAKRLAESDEWRLQFCEDATSDWAAISYYGEGQLRREDRGLPVYDVGSEVLPVEHVTRNAREASASVETVQPIEGE